ncbi:MAG TPA: NADPH:quinone oxidoreductase family protein [Rhizomicrobium sp.]|jgi:NADPH2:quinone reductase|nr:NADPH:quinone oxidoreductase family protein [Rhizomicrobium sp.]
MKALVCRAISEDIGTLRLEEVSLPPPARGEVRVRIRAAAVNFPDILTVQGKYQHKPALPFTPGMEAAGEVVACGADVVSVKPGDRVIAGGLGCFAEEVQLPETSLRPTPAGIDDALAAGFTAAYLTAYVGLVRRARLEKGEWLLVHGAAGGVGLAAADLGRALGAKVMATASTDVKRAFLQRYGVDRVLPSSGFREQVKALSGGRGADVIFDPVGGDVFDESTRCIAFDGRLLVVGFASGRIPEIGANIPLIKGFSVVGMRAGEYGRRFPERGRENIAAIDGMLGEGLLHPCVGARFPLDRAADAMRMLLERRAVGKVIVEP